MQYVYQMKNASEEFVGPFVIAMMDATAAIYVKIEYVNKGVVMITPVMTIKPVLMDNAKVNPNYLLTICNRGRRIKWL